MSRHLAAFSFDIEDWHHSQLLPANTVKPGPSGSVVRAGTERILEQLRRHGVRSTFFVLGEVIRDHPDLVRRMVAEGHEIGCHGMHHQPLWLSNREAFRDELREFRALVREQLGDVPVTGFRAPTFSIDRRTAWALEVLSEEGFAYDSSIFPARVKMYGVPEAPVGIYRPSRADLSRHDPAGPLVEFPVAIARWGPIRLPVGGGFYLRALPFGLFRWSLDHILRTRPFALYLHPRETHPEEKRLPLDPVDGFISYVNLHTVVEKLERLYPRYRWVPMREILEREGHLSGAAAPARDPAPAPATSTSEVA
ncbi:MAG: polysaccharide deacetylase family protein [Candidatus Eisenbacteria bacterium]